MTDDRWIYDYWNFISFTVDNQSSLSSVLIVFTFTILSFSLIKFFSRWRCRWWEDDDEEEEKEEQKEEKSVQVVSTLSV